VRALSFSLEWIGSLTVAAALAGTVGYRLAGRSRDARLRKLQQGLRRTEQLAQQLRRSTDALNARIGEIEKRCGRLQHTLIEIPDVAQQLSATRKAREIPENVLEFVQKVFQPLYSVFYRASRGALVAVAVHGKSEFAVGHRTRMGEGVVGWSALRQLSVSSDDLRPDAGTHATIAPAEVSEQAFSQCVPVTSESRTLGVILIGPCERTMPHRSELARTIALITSVALTRAEVLKEQSRLAETDGLTGLLNRTHLLKRAKALLRASPSSVAFFLFDIDHFKQYNDTNGHLPGDELLKSLSALLRENTREEELVGRYGGEEFLIVMPNADREQALRASERIRALIAATPFAHGEKQPGGCVSVSGGLSVWPIDGDDLETLLKRADEALYAAKRAGRNRVCPHAKPELGREGDTGRVAQAVAQALFGDESEHGLGSEAGDATPGLAHRSGKPPRD